MASFASGIGVSEPYVQSHLFLRVFRLGSRKPNANNVVEYLSIFQEVNRCGNAEAKGLLQSLYAQRRTVQLELASERFSPAATLAALQAYLPMISTLLESLNHQPRVPIVGELSFSWKGAFDTSSMHTQYTELAYEICMVLHSTSIMHYLIALDFLDANNLREASQQFLLAASVAKHLSQDFLPRWTNRSSKSSPPPEIHEYSSMLFHHLCICAAQQCAIVTALRKPEGSQAAVLARLCSGVVRQAELALTMRPEVAASSGSGSSGSRIDKEMYVHSCFLKELFSALAYEFQGQALMAKSNTGSALASLSKACALLVQQGSPSSSASHDPSKSGLPAFRGSYIDIAVPIEQLLVQIQAEASRAKLENEQVYFEPVPAFGDVVLPQEALIAIPSNMPAIIVKVVELGPDSQKGGEANETLLPNFSSLSVAASASSSVPPPPASSDNGRARSDSQMARELQQRLDSGEEI